MATLSDSCGQGIGHNGGGGGGGGRWPPLAPSPLPCSDKHKRQVRSIGAKRRAARRWNNRSLRPPTSLQITLNAAAPAPRAPPPRSLPANSEASSSRASLSHHRRCGDAEELEKLRRALAQSKAEAEERERADRKEVELAIAAVDLAKRAEELEAKTAEDAAEDAGAVTDEEVDWGLSDDAMEVDIVVIDD